MKTYRMTLKRMMMTALMMLITVSAMSAEQKIWLSITGKGTVEVTTDKDPKNPLIFADGVTTLTDAGGQMITISVKPQSGYTVTSVKAQLTTDAGNADTRTDVDASFLDVKKASDSEYTFEMPKDFNVRISVTFESVRKGGNTILSEIINNPAGTYIITDDIDATGYSTIATFTGKLTAEAKSDGTFPVISNLSVPLFTTATDATISNIILDNVIISRSGKIGSIACIANGATRIYNCGILSGSVGSTGTSSAKNSTDCCGGLVGELAGTARVINCYSYATIIGGNRVGGIVGYNSGTTTAGSINTMVMNCMFYGDITAGNVVNPVYGGNNINNLHDGLNTFNYYAYDKLKTKIINYYNCALAVEEKYLNRIEFYRLLLNSNKKLAAFYATGSADNANQMLKWVLETADRTNDNPKPYPVLKAQGYYSSIINPDFENAPDSATVGRNKGGKLGKTLSVTISGVGSNAPTGASITTSSLTLQRTDKDEDRFNFNYDKVQLPYYNDVGEGNYTENKVVTGWKITAIDAVTGDPYASGNYDYTKVYSSNATYFDYPNYNFADRKSSNKDLYSVSGRVFSQGAYFDVPYGVSSITIEPYWGNAAYVSDEYLDVVCKMEKTKRSNPSDRNDYVAQQVTQLGKQFDSQTITIDGSPQTVYTSVAAALADEHLTDGNVYDNAVVLVGNLHQIGAPSDGDKAFTMMSVDLDKDNEPDYSLIFCDNNRCLLSPLRFDFLNIPGMAQAQKPRDTGVLLNAAIFRTKGWFEITNTAMMYFSQFEYENLGKNTGNNNTQDNGGRTADAPLILQGGFIDQFVSTQNTDVKGKVIYIHVGGNVLINSFGLGTHSDGSKATPHVPVSVTGGDFKEFYLTGTYNQNANIKDDNAECYISGGRFGELAGAAQEQIGANTNAKGGNVRWQIYDADITDFFGGGINDAKPVKGNITTDIFYSHVGTFCGGPKFGNMATGKTVTTTAEGCTFDKYFGAGYGGNSYSRKKYFDNTSYNWSTLQGYYNTDRGKYFDGKSTDAVSSQYGKKGPGVATDFDYEFFVWTNGTAGVRYYVKFASFSLAQCNNVVSNLKKCKIKDNFYGGGNLGKVSGTATSTLEDCTVTGDVFGAGYSATLPKIKVRSNGNFATLPVFNGSSGMFEPGVPALPTSTDLTGTDEFEWKQVENYPSEGGAGFDGKQVITTQNISPSNLGSVGSVNLTILGNTTVGGSVYGGGALASMDTSGETKVNLIGGTINGDVYGGGQGRLPGTKDEHNKDLPEVKALVGNAHVNLNGLDAVDYKAKYTNMEQEGNNGPYVVKSNEKGCIVKGSIFGCNNLNGSPQGTVTVHIYKTQNAAASTIGNPAEGEQTAKVVERYDVKAVYGGGNLAAYEPAGGKNTTNSTNVIIDGCGLTSIQYVYGGGNAASTPATNVTVNGTFEIEELFGGGNGKDDVVTNGVTKPNPGANVGYKDYSEYYQDGDVWKVRDKEDADTKEERLSSDYCYGTGKASVNVFGGTIHRVFGGSNTKGNVRQTAVTLLDENSGCDFCVDEAYGGGKSAPMDAEAKLLMSCIPGLNAAYGGAEAADIQGNVTLNITNGTFDRVFGGNNLSGTIGGSITVNVEEVGCKPIKIGELYGGGNEAGYSVYGYNDDGTPKESGGTSNCDDPQVNVMSFTSIGNIYGGGFGSGATMVGNPTVNVNEAYGKYYNNDLSVVGENAKTSGNYPIPSHVKGKMGAINNVFGGGNAAKVIGNTNVNIGTLSEVYVVKTVSVGASVEGYFTRNNDGTYSAATGTASESATYYEKKDVIGADIRGNVYGGGNNAEVTGNTNVTIGKRNE